MKSYGKMIVAALLLLLISSFPFKLSAHPASIMCQGGSEMLGWSVDCNNHQATNSFKWYTPIPNSSSAVDYPYRLAIQTATNKWKDTVTITNTTVSSNNGYIYTVSDPNTSITAEFHDYSSNSQGHLSAWKIKLNKKVMDSMTVGEKAVVVAHELGHAIGLNDLKLAGNKDKLMYGYWPLTAVSPTEKDIIGAKEATRH